MPGKRRDFAGSFAMAEVDFWLNDPRIKSCRSTTKLLFHYAWMIAVKERRECLPTWWRPRDIGMACGLDPKTTAIAYAQLLEKSLLKETPDGRITVCHVSSKHPNLTWKECAISENLPDQIESESESESERGLAPPKPPPESSEKTEPKGKTRAPTETEAAFIEGFHNLHGHDPTIGAGHAIRLNQLVSKHGPELVVEKIRNWWRHELPATFSGNRTIAAFLTWFDSIPVNGDKSQRDHAPPVYELPAVPERMTPEEVATWQETVHGLARKWDAT